MTPRVAPSTALRSFAPGRASGLQTIATLWVACALASCAVGPNFKAPTAPTTHGYVAGGLPANTAASEAKGGAAQHYVEGLDIPGQWWTLFQSPPLNDLIDRALARNPTLEAAQAALRQANETLAAQRGTFFPAVAGSLGAQRSKSSGAAIGEPCSPEGLPAASGIRRIIRPRLLR